MLFLGSCGKSAGLMGCNSFLFCFWELFSPFIVTVSLSARGGTSKKMREVPKDQPLVYPTEPDEYFFYELWFSMNEQRVKGDCCVNVGQTVSNNVMNKNALKSWKRTILIALDFQLIPHSFFLDMAEKQRQMKALTSFFCMQNSLCMNADWTNLSLHLKLL